MTNESESQSELDSNPVVIVTQELFVTQQTRCRQNQPFWKRWVTRFDLSTNRLLKKEQESFERQELEQIITSSQLMKSQIIEHYKVNPNKIKVIPIGIPWKQMQTDFDTWPTRKEELCQAYRLNPRSFQVLLILDPKTVIEPFFDAFKRLTFHDFQLTIIGTEAQIKAIRPQVENLAYRDRVRFLGPRGSRASFYQYADCLLAPTPYHPYFEPVVEALGMGLFVIASRYDGAHEAITLQSGVVITDVYNQKEVRVALETALERRKTPKNAQIIRNTVQHLDKSASSVA